ncbi:MAG: OstA family protein [Chitinophagaceae bacterium]|nr:OstA family protein [Chitinophagaceae bacterium]
MKFTALPGFLIFVSLYTSAQVPPPSSKADSLNQANQRNIDTLNSDTSKVVEILSAQRYGYSKKDSVNELLLLVGKVALKQAGTIFYADSAVYNKNDRFVEAFKNVHINDRDSVHAYSDYLIYHTDTKVAFLKKKVRLTDGQSTLYTEELQYDVTPKVGVYRNGGRVVNGTSVLTSDEGTYYADLKDFYFKDDVKLKDPQYYLESDSLLYNTNTEIATFISDTYIEDSVKRTIRTKEGYYDLKNKNASFGQRPTIHDGSMIIIANNVDTDDRTGMSVLTGNAIFRDTAEGLTVRGNLITSNRATGSMVATQRPVMVITQDKDSTFITADTLYSGRLSELPVVDTVQSDSSIAEIVDTSASGSNTDSVAKTIIVDSAAKQRVRTNDTLLIKTSPQKNPPVVTVTNDSADRFFRAYYNVRVFSDSLQAVCDSLFYSGKDSIFRLFNEPVVWSGESQVTGDTIYMYTKNKKPHELYVFENGLMVNKTGSNMYNQIKGNRLFGYFKEGEIDNIRAKGNAESIYYAKDEEEKIIGINKATSDIIDMRFKNKELNKVVFISAVTGTMLPFTQASEDDRRLRNFKWHEDRRPKSKFELMSSD